MWNTKTYPFPDLDKNKHAAKPTNQTKHNVNKPLPIPNTKAIVRQPTYFLYVQESKLEEATSCNIIVKHKNKVKKLETLQRIRNKCKQQLQSQKFFQVSNQNITFTLSI